MLKPVAFGQMRPHGVVDEFGQPFGHRVRTAQGEPSRIQADQSQPMPEGWDAATATAGVASQPMPSADTRP